MTLRHSILTGDFLHEPKGIATAAVDTVYIADGAGSGAWSAFPGDTYPTLTVAKLTIQGVDTTTLTADNTLLFSVLANSLYLLRFNISCDGGSSNDYKMALQVPTGTILSGSIWYRNVGSSTVNGGIIPNHNLGESQVIQTDNGAENVNISGEGAIITSSTAGFVTLMFARNNSVGSASASTLAGSYIDYQRIV
jgi:hypothetical protein